MPLCGKLRHCCIELAPHLIAQAVTSTFDDLDASGPDAINRIAAAREDPAVDQLIPAASRQRGMRGIERNDVCPCPFDKAANRLRQGLLYPSRRPVG